jgi:Putative bacterial sensory transduction regulator
MQNKTTYPLSKPLIERALDSLGVKYQSDSEGDIFVIFPEEEKVGSEIYVWFMVEGTDNTIFNILSSVAPKIPQSKWPNALLTCNEFHMKARYGRAFIGIKDECSDANLFFDSQVLLEEEIKEDFLESYIRCFYISARNFFEIAHLEKQLY